MCPEWLRLTQEASRGAQQTARQLPEQAITFKCGGDVLSCSHTLLCQKDDEVKAVCFLPLLPRENFLLVLWLNALSAVAHQCHL